MALVAEASPQSFYLERKSYYKNKTDLQVWEEYFPLIGTLQGRRALEELLARHDGLLKEIAGKIVCFYGDRIGTYEDFLQHARYASMEAYARFNPFKGVKLSTFVKTTAHYFVLSKLDQDSFIHCPTYLRKMKKYLSGKYDKHPEKKEEVERELGLINKEAIEEARKKYWFLNSKISPSGEVFPVQGEVELNPYRLALQADLDLIKSQLTERQREVYELLLWQEYTVPEVAKVLDITEGRVRSALRAIRRIATLHESATNP